MEAAIVKLQESVLAMWEEFLLRVPLIAIAVLILLVTWLVARLAGTALTRALHHSPLRDSLKALLRKVVHLAIWSSGILIAAMTVVKGLTLSSLVGALGLTSVAIGFAFKDIFENFLAGILLLFREPFQLGDHIECEEIEGRVEEITIRDTRVRQTDGQVVVVPNAMLFKNPVTVLTDQPRRRVSVTCGVAYDVDLNQAREVLRAAMEQIDGIDRDKPIEIFATEFGASSVDFVVRWWTDSQPKQVLGSRDQVIRALKQALDEAGIEIPFPYRTLTFKEPLTTRLEPGSLEEVAQGKALDDEAA